MNTNSSTNKTVLVLTHCPEQYELTASMLAEIGYSVLIERDQRQAIDIVRSAPPKVVISELAADNVDGLQLCTLLRGEAWPPVTQLLLVGDLPKHSSIVADGLDSGAVDYLQKPVDQIALYERCSLLLGFGGACEEPADNATNAVIVLDADGRVLVDQSAGFFGHHAKLTGRKISEFIHPADAAEFNEFISSAFWLGEACGTVEYRFRGIDGGWPLIESRARAIEHPQFGPAVVLDFCEKHHERFPLAGALENELLRQSMFDNAAVGMALLSPSGHIVETNRALRDMLDHPAEELYGMALAEMILPRNPEADRRALADVMSGRRKSYRFRNGYYLPNGDSLWGELTLVSLSGCPDERCLMLIFEDPFAAKREFEFPGTSSAANVLDISRWKAGRGVMITN